MFREKLNNLNFLALCFLSCFPILGMKITVIAIIAFTVLSVFSAIASPANIVPGKWKDLLILLFPFLLIFLRTYVLDRSEDSVFYLEVSMSLLAFPAAFFLSTGRHSESKKNLLKIIFIISTMLIVIYGEVKVLISLLQHLGPD